MPSHPDSHPPGGVGPALLGLARHAVEEAVAHGRLPESIPTAGILEERRGVFVTLHSGGRLRGCIGVIEPDEPLAHSIVRCAASAAHHDPRFAPVSVAELPLLEFEISLLSPLFAIEPQAVEIGLHGLVVACGAHKGLLLPQVAVEHRLTREQFLEETCHKAGLPRSAWRSPETHLRAFTCEVFSDGKPRTPGKDNPG